MWFIVFWGEYRIDQISRYILFTIKVSPVIVVTSARVSAFLSKAAVVGLIVALVTFLISLHNLLK